MLILVALTGCADSQIVFAPVIDLPQNDSASAFPLDQLTMSAAHDGSLVDLASATFTKGHPVELAGVPFADDLVVHLTGLVGTSEEAYGRTCAVALSADTPPPSPHLFFSRSARFAELAAPFPALRVSGSAITYHDGSGLLLGGSDPNTNALVTDVERFDPLTGQLRTLTSDNDMLAPRVSAVVASAGVGKDAQIAVIGGLDPSTGIGAAFVELIEADNPVGRRIDRVDSDQMARTELTATTLTDGRVIVIGGRPPPNGVPVTEVDQVAIENSTAVVTQARGVLTTARYGHTATRLSDDVGADVLVVGGIDANGNFVATTELYKPLIDTFANPLTFNFPLAYPRSHHTAVRLPDGSVLIIGGVSYDMTTGIQPELHVERFSLDGGFVTQPQHLDANEGVIDFTATTLPDGRILLTGGRTEPGGPPVDTAYYARLNSDGTADILATDHLIYPRAGHQATLMCDGTVLISGGSDTQVPAERYNPPPDGRR
jgi:hypothetical protein